MTASVSPDFHLASLDYPDFKGPRRCYRIKRLQGEHRDDFLAIRVDPGLPGQDYGYGHKDIDTFVSLPRHVGCSLFPVTKWPLDVHVFIPRDDSIVNLGKLRKDQLYHIAWAELYPTAEDARNGVSV